MQDKTPQNPDAPHDAKPAPAKPSGLAAIPVSQCMTTTVVKIGERTTVKTAIKTLLKKQVAGIPVVNDREELVGVVSEKDLLLQAASGSIKKAVQFCTTPESFMPDTTFKEALVTMVRDNRKWLPVIDERKKVLGIVARRDLLRVLSEQDTGD